MLNFRTRPTLQLALVATAFAPASNALGFCRVNAQNAFDCCTPDRADCVSIAWQRPCIALSVDSGFRDLPADRVGAIVDGAFGVWTDIDCGSGPSGFQVQRYNAPSECDRAEFNSAAGNINSIGFVDDWNARGLERDGFAITTVWNDKRTGKIFDVDIEVNQERWFFRECPNDGGGCTTGEVDLQAVLAKEAGHFFGLGFSDIVGATMSPSVNRPGDVAARTLELDDLAGFCAIYPDGAPTAACDFTPEGGYSAECGGGLGCCSVQSDTAPADATLMFLVAWYLRRRSRRRR